VVAPVRLGDFPAALTGLEALAGLGLLMAIERRGHGPVGFSTSSTQITTNSCSLPATTITSAQRRP
jgi:hypothetical protein